MAKTTKAARLALYKTLQLPENVMKTFEKDLKNSLPRLRKLFEIDDDLSPEDAKLAIIDAYAKEYKDAERRNIDRVQNYGRLAPKFLETFGIPMRTFWPSKMPELLLGFDLVAFDEKFICPHEDESCEEAVRRLFGEEAVELVRQLIAA